ncbi:calmodulin-regulated spectrin-associated protein 2a isoform X3 [Erpetoichthys calabaricus]|uniref:calmodulin-regulated spectrin-associated protein 2a isoform X3 n=1 Tax=Erpetoichthys calabaricus TaxID=27687 RepID=UPI00109F8FE1|nr:calmodulin-regulated spectrin-associated protein 2a isoform X3 [Erpetoichthys calabaricus]
MGDAADSKETKKTFIVPAIKSFDHYDFSRAKIACTLTWLVAKGYGTDNVPADLKEPFYTDQYDQEHIKPPVVNLLLSAELYCRAGSLILKSDAAKPLLGHDAVIQALAQRGLYVTDQEKLVTERDLRKKPIQMNAHLAMIDTLMMAYTVEMVSVEKVVKCVQQYSTFYPDTDMPYDTEDAIICWINKVNEHLKEIILHEQKIRESQSSDTPAGPRARYRKEQTMPRQMPCIPPVENLLKDSTDGCALAALIHFYCPDLVKLEDICLKETMSLADSLYNLQLIQEFCQENLNRCCHFTLEDMIYASSSIKNNYLVFMAELFWWFEVVKPPFVQPRVVEIDELVQPVRSIPTVPISNATKRSFMDNPSASSTVIGQTPSLPASLLPLRHSQQNPQKAISGVMRRSTSMSYVDGCIGTWPKEKRSSVHGVSFDIPFDKENTVQSTAAPIRGMTRSISNEGLGFKVNPFPRNIKRNLLFQPVNGQNETEGIEEEIYLTETSGRCAEKNSQVRLANGPVLDDYGNHAGTPSIEEALQIIHDSEKMQGVIQTEKVNNGFFLHSQEIGVNSLKLKREEVLNDSNDEAKGSLSPDTTEVDTGIHVRTEDIQETMDEDSSLKDYTVSMDSDMDHDYELKVGHTREIVSPCPSSVSIKSQAGSTTSSGSGVKMTSFAEQKFKKLNHVDGRSSGSSSQKTTPESSELNIPHMVSWAQTPEESPVKQGKDPTQLLASEMVQLRMKLEEKRRAIEAQKKKVEAAFTRHRQRMGRTAFLTVVKKKGDGTSPLREEAAGSEDEKLSSDDHISKSPEDNRIKPGKCKNDILDNLDSPQSRWLKSPNEEAIVEGDLLEYTKSIEKLNSSLFFLQQEMQRLAQQQEVIMQMREQQAWVISPPQPSPQKQVRELRTSSRSTGSMSPVLSSGESPRTSHRSPQTITRKSASFNSKTPRTPRPSDLKLTPFNRILTPPQSVDSLPRLRRFSPSQTQTRSFVCLGDDHSIQKDLDSADHTSAEEDKTIDSAKEGCSVKEGGLEELPVVEKAIDNEEKTKEVGGLQVEKKEDNKGKLLESSVSEILSQTVTETVIVTPNVDSSVEFNADTSKNSSLIEVPLSVLKPLDGEVLEEANDGEAGMDNYDEEQKMCCGFFFKDDQKGEDDMAMKRAALLEKRLRREKENQQRKQQLEAELEQKKEEARVKAEEDRQKKEDEKARREFIKQEYLRRKQLKLMEDMDTVIKPRPASCKQKKPRPKSVHRDIMESPKTPVRAPAGSRPRVFSVSSLSLASLNLGDNDSIQSGRRTPRSSSINPGSLYHLLKSTKLNNARPESADGFLSPCRSASRNGEKDWENGSTTSSVASNTEYTGPKLYKEPSAKSNKHIIQNALAHCCLAGKVNEGQKNKILEEMEKSEANNFLILFRDSGCQFRSLYTYCPEMEEINKLAGIGPKSITLKMIEGLYKYNSDRKQFSHIPAKTMSASVDAITIHSHLWQTKRPVTPKKILPSKS